MDMPKPLPPPPEGADRLFNKGVIYNLQALRALAASLVVFYHVQGSAGAVSGLRYHSDFGAFGVDIFFVISGFIMFHTTAGFRRTGTDFIVDRMVRVLPLYWIATLLLYGLYRVGFNANGVHSAPPLDVLSSLALYPRNLPNGTPLLLSLGWTLIYEMLFYLLFAATFFMRSHTRSLIALSSVFVGLALSSRAFPDLPFSAAYFTNAIVFEFLFGAALTLAIPHLPPLPGKTLLLVGCVLVALGFVAMIGVPIQRLDKGLSLESRALRAGLPALCVVAGALLAESAEYRWRFAPVISLGAASYALYLFHPLILQPAMKVFGALVHTEGIAVLVAANVFAFAVCSAAAVALHLFLERPITARLKRRRLHPRDGSEETGKAGSLARKGLDPVALEQG